MNKLEEIVLGLSEVGLNMNIDKIKEQWRQPLMAEKYK